MKMAQKDSNAILMENAAKQFERLKKSGLLTEEIIGMCMKRFNMKRENIEESIIKDIAVRNFIKADEEMIESLKRTYQPQEIASENKDGKSKTAKNTFKNETELYESAWNREFNMASEYEMYRTVIPFLDQFQFVLMVFTSEVSYRFLDEFPDRVSGEVIIRLERIGSKNKRDTRAKQPKSNFDECIKFVNKSLQSKYPEYKEKNWKGHVNISVSSNFLARKLGKADSSTPHKFSNNVESKINPKVIFQYMKKFLAGVSAEGKAFPMVIREWERELMETDPCPVLRERFRMTHETGVRIPREEYESLVKSEPQIEDPILPPILLFVSAFEPEYMQEYFNYLHEICSPQAEENIAKETVHQKQTRKYYKDAQSGRLQSIALGLELRWFVREFNRAMSDTIDKIRFLRHYSDFQKEEAFALVIARLKTLYQGYHEFCKLAINLASSTIPSASLLWLLELFYYINEEGWSETGDECYTCQCLPLHLLRSHPQFSELPKLWKINSDDFEKLTEVCEAIQMPCSNMTDSPYMNAIFNTSFGVIIRDSKIWKLKILLSNSVARLPEHLRDWMRSFQYLLSEFD